MDEQLSPLLRSFIPQDSWAQRTIIRPLPGREFDADLLVSMKPQRRWSHDPGRYLLALYESLASSSRYRGKAELKTRRNVRDITAHLMTAFQAATEATPIW